MYFFLLLWYIIDFLLHEKLDPSLPQVKRFLVKWNGEQTNYFKYLLLPSHCFSFSYFFGDYETSGCSTFHISLNIWEKADYMCQFSIGNLHNVTHDDRFNAEHRISKKKKYTEPQKARHLRILMCLFSIFPFLSLPLSLNGADKGSA